MWWYIFGFVVIGLFAGLCMKSLWPDGIKTSRTVMSLLGIAGSLVGGMFTLLGFSYGRNYDSGYGISDMTAAQAARIIGPSSWLSLIAAIVVAMLFIAIHGLLNRKLD